MGMKIPLRFGASIATLMLLCTLAPITPAQADGPSLSLTQALSIARERNPAIGIAREKISAAEGARTQAGLIPNPSLTATSENQPYSGSPGFSFANQTDDYIYASQTIELGGKRKRRTAAAEAGVQAAAQEAQIAARQLAARVASAYWAANGAGRIRDLYNDEARMLDRMVAYDQARVKEGAAAEADLLRIQLEADRMRASANLAGAEAQRALVALYREMGSTDFPQQVTFTDAMQAIDRLEVPAIDEVLLRRPEMLLARARLEQARANLSLERANAIPDPDLMFGYKRWSGYNQFTGLNTMFFGAKIPIPIFNRNQGKVSAAEAQLRSAEQSLKAEEIAVRAEVASALSDYSRSREALNQIMPVMSDRADRNLDMTREAYRIGGTNLVRYLDAERMRIETQVLYTKTLGQYHQSAVNLEYATGMIQ